MVMFIKLLTALLLFGFTLAFGVTAFFAGYAALRHGQDVLNAAAIYLAVSVSAGTLFTFLASNLAAHRGEISDATAVEVFAPLLAE